MYVGTFVRWAGLAAVLVAWGAAIGESAAFDWVFLKIHKWFDPPKECIYEGAIQWAYVLCAGHGVLGAALLLLTRDRAYAVPVSVSLAAAVVFAACEDRTCCAELPREVVLVLALSALSAVVYVRIPGMVVGRVRRAVTPASWRKSPR